MSSQMRCKAFETLIGTICMPMCADVHPNLIYILLFFPSLCYLFTSNFDVRMASFLSHCWIPV